MSRSRFKEKLDLTIKQQLSFPQKSIDGSGAYNRIYFEHPKHIRVSLLGENKVTIPLKLAYCIPFYENSHAFDASRLLKKRDVCLDFIVNYFYTDVHGRKVSPKATYDWNYILKTFYLDPEQLKPIVAQMLLAVYDLHSKNISHGDIHPGNFLAYQVGSHFWVQLSDLDSIQAVEERKPEHKTTKTDSNSSLSLEESMDSKISDPLEIDLFYLGKCLGYMRAPCSQLQDLIDQLQKKVPGKSSITIEQAMQNEFFGKTPEERILYFKTVREKYNKMKFLIDGNIITPVEPGDPYWLLSSEIRSIRGPLIRIAESIDNNLPLLHSKDFSQLILAIPRVTTILQDEKNSLDIVSSTLSKSLSEAFANDLTELKSLQLKFLSDNMLIKQGLTEILAVYQSTYTQRVTSSCFFTKTHKHPSFAIVEKLCASILEEDEKKSHDAITLLQDFLNESDTDPADSILKDHIAKKLLQLPLEVQERSGLSLLPSKTKPVKFWF